MRSSERLVRVVILGFFPHSHRASIGMFHFGYSTIIKRRYGRTNPPRARRIEKSLTSRQRPRFWTFSSPPVRLVIPARSSNDWPDAPSDAFGRFPPIPYWKCPIVACPNKIMLSDATSALSIKKGSAPVRGLWPKCRPFVIITKLAVPITFGHCILLSGSGERGLLATTRQKCIES